MTKIFALLTFLVTVVFSAGGATAGQILKSDFYPPFQQDRAMQEENITPEDLQKLDAGKTIIHKRSVPKGRKGAHFMAARTVRGSVDHTFDVVMDCKGQPAYVPHLAACTNSYVKSVSEPAIVNFVQTEKLKFGFGFISKEVIYTLDVFAMRPYVKGWVFREGDLKSTEGYWRIIPYKDGRQILIYDIYLEPGLAVPGWIQEILTKQDLPGAVESYAKRADNPAPVKD